jgi:hypothetical protein
MNEQHMLTTKDNPWNPFKDFNEWYSWDVANGYHTLSYLARITVTSYELSDADQSRATEQAIDDIIELDPFDVYIKVKDPAVEQTEDSAA